MELIERERVAVLAQHRLRRVAWVDIWEFLPNGPCALRIYFSPHGVRFPIAPGDVLCVSCQKSDHNQASRRRKQLVGLRNQVDAVHFRDVIDSH